jgi:predicted Zn-dependent protease with MMP-like domain
MAAFDSDTAAYFEKVAQETWDSLPREFRDVVGNLVIQVRDFASRDTLDDMGLDSRYDLLGLYHGVGLPFKATWDLPQGPDMIFLYRLPILAYAREEGESVEAVIRHVLIHEVGHHFGFSDEDMDAIEEGAD